MLTDAPEHQEILAGGLRLRSIRSMEDVDRLAVFNAMIHGPELDAITRALIVEHPHTRPQHWLIVEDPAAGGQIVSSLCLIPWRWRYEDVELPAGEMGIVGTHPDYRRRGLVRALDRRFKTLLADEGWLLSHIQGIPYYYRQFGYEYALPLEGGWQIAPHQVPEPDDARGLEGAAPYTFRLATADDLPALEALYAGAVRHLAIWAVRDAAVWRYLLEQGPGTAADAQTWLVLKPGGQIEGYVRIAARGFGAGLIVEEASDLGHAAALATLRFAKHTALERGKPYVRLSLTDGNPLVRAARAWGAHSERRYAWQIYLPDAVRLLRAIAPVLERRLADSAFAGLTHTLTLSLFRSAVALEFEGGRLIKVESVPPQDFAHANHIPPSLLAPLVLGWRSREELREAFPDCSAWGQTAYLIDVLFPKLDGFLYTQY